jgi:hypothetical protein
MNSSVETQSREDRIAAALREAKNQGLPEGWTLTLDVSYDSYLILLLQWPCMIMHLSIF